MIPLPKVSVCIITYNHESFISQAIESALMQELDAPYEIVIGEDFSADGTREICTQYQQRHPDKIRLIDRTQNLGMVENFVQTMKECRGEYIALLEGDDYWNSTEKLQMQADFMDRNPEYAITTHNALVLDMESNRFSGNFPDYSLDDTLTLRDILGNGSGGATCSIMYRNMVFGDYPDAFKKIRGVDVPLQILCASKGKMKFFSNIMGVYRVHDRGAYYYLDLEAQKKQIPTPELLFSNMLYANNIINQYFHYRYWYLILRLDTYPLWKASEYYCSLRSYLKAIYYYLRALPGLFPPPKWMHKGEFLALTKKIFINPFGILLSFFKRKLQNH